MINTLSPTIYVKNSAMIKLDNEIFSKPYYFFLKKKENDYNLYFSSEETLTEARQKDVMIKVPADKLEKVKKYIDSLLKKKEKKSTKKIEGEIEELVDADGSLSYSKIPILDPTLHPKKTMDQTVSAARITNDPIARGYRTYYGESVEEVSEEDMSGAFGYEETKDLDGKETFEYFKDELEMPTDEAKKRTKEQGKDPSGKKDQKSKFKKDKNFIAKMTISEIQRQKMLKMVEDILMKRKNYDNSEIGKKETVLSKILKKNLKTLKRQAEREGVNLSDLIKALKSE